jgi:hypothetical protein
MSPQPNEFEPIHKKAVEALNAGNIVELEVALDELELQHLLTDPNCVLPQDAEQAVNTFIKHMTAQDR